MEHALSSLNLPEEQDAKFSMGFVWLVPECNLPPGYHQSNTLEGLRPTSVFQLLG